MNAAEKVRRIYQQRPYPSIKPGAKLFTRWRLPAMEWINAIWQPRPPVPRTILVAGCGTGAEAFSLAHRFRLSEIVAVDFSSKSIAIAKKLQRNNPQMRHISFVVGDLASRSFDHAAPGKFDLISCHGVLSYVPRVDRALRNLARRLSSDGALYLGVNGASHFSANWRRVLPDFGFETEAYRDSEKLSKVVALLDALTDDRISEAIKKEPGYLAGDLFGPTIRNLPLSVWIRMGEKVGLHFRGGYAANAIIRAAINNKSFEVLFPRSRAEVAELLDILHPASYHQLIFTKRPEVLPPWQRRDQFMAWRPITTMHLRENRWPKPRGTWNTLRDLKIKMPQTNTLIKLRLPEWELEILRNARGERTLREILAPVRQTAHRETAVQQLYLLHHLNVLNFVPPRGRLQADGDRTD